MKGEKKKEKEKRLNEEKERKKWMKEKKDRWNEGRKKEWTNERKKAEIRQAPWSDRYYTRDERFFQNIPTIKQYASK